MKKILLFFITVISSTFSVAQPNCEILKNDRECYNACKKAWKAIRYKQGSFKSQQLFDESIGICPSFAYAYMEKAVPFLKRGQFIQWKKLIDKAVELSPSEYLGYRGWCRIQFLRDYKGAIDDIEELKRIVSYDIGHCQNGNYHLEVALALCYKELGHLEKAKSIISKHIYAPNYSPDLFDHYHLGVIEYNLGYYESAKDLFIRQLENNSIADAYYYLSLTYEKLDQKTESSAALDKAEEFYLKGQAIYDNYTEPIDKIYLSDIQKAKAQIRLIDNKN